MPFLTPLKLQLLNDREILPFLTIAPLVYECPLTGETYTIPAYFRTDGASVPKYVGMLPGVGPLLFMRFFGEGVWQGFKEGVLHDWLRREKGGITPVSAKVAHLIFKEALVERGYPEDLVNCYYAAVREFNS